MLVVFGAQTHAHTFLHTRCTRRWARARGTFIQYLTGAMLSSETRRRVVSGFLRTLRLVRDLRLRALPFPTVIRFASEADTTPRV